MTHIKIQTEGNWEEVVPLLWLQLYKSPSEKCSFGVVNDPENCANITKEEYERLSSILLFDGSRNTLDPTLLNPIQLCGEKPNPDLPTS